ncbi:MAG: cysteine-rich small domain-containing protein [Clostridiales bacterium]|nr:cysteine-rich small domain-containing protein [Clostridiales bacterium]
MHSFGTSATTEKSAKSTVSESASDKTQNYRYFSHKDCEYFPCHAAANPDNFNCLFCYCPFYLLGDQCGGNFRYLSTGVKDCTDCLYPHLRENYDEITARYQEIRDAMPRSD